MRGATECGFQDPGFVEGITQKTGQGGSALSASCINCSKRGGSVGSFMGLLIKEVKKFDRFVAQKVASDLYRAAAEFLHARARDGQLVEARPLRILNVRAIHNPGNPRPVARREAHGALWQQREERAGDDEPNHLFGTNQP